MKLITNGERITVTGQPRMRAEEIRYPLETMPAAIGPTVRLETDNGMHLRTDRTADWLRTYLDGTTLVLTDTPEPVQEAPDLHAMRAEKLTELNEACEGAIAAGCSVTLSDGTEGHIRLTIADQINLTTAQGAVQAGGTGYAYHLDGELCAVYPAADITILAKAATAHVLYQQTYCNHARAWAKRAGAAELADITYGAALPEDLAAHMAAVLQEAAAASGKV